MWRVRSDLHLKESSASSQPQVVARGVGVKWLYLAIAAIGLGVSVALTACGSPAGTTSGTQTQTAYLIAVNYGPETAILTVDLQPPVQAHVEIDECNQLTLNVPVDDSVEVVITDSTADTSATFEVPFYQAGVWGVDCAPGSGGPRAIGAIGETSTQCQSEAS
jgi:hypothetical protein